MKCELTKLNQVEPSERRKKVLPFDLKTREKRSPDGGRSLRCYGEVTNSTGVNAVVRHFGSGLVDANLAGISSGMGVLGRSSTIGVNNQPHEAITMIASQSSAVSVSIG
jgi:hypothetical protein